MRSYLTSAFLAAACLVAPVAAGYAPALSQDFTITNPGAGPGSDWTRKLQAWWDLHAYYPPDALEKKQDGTVKVHLIIQSDGEVWKPEVVQGSGSRSLDMAAYEVFKNGHLPPFPPGAIRITFTAARTKLAGRRSPRGPLGTGITPLP